MSLYLLVSTDIRTGKKHELVVRAESFGITPAEGY